MGEKKTVEIGHLAARLLAVRLPMGLTVDEVIIQGEDLHLENHPLHLQMKNAGTLEVRISADNLAAFLERKAPGGLSGFSVRFQGGEIHVEAVARVIIAVNVGAVCRLRIHEGKELYVELDRVDAIGGQGAFNMVQTQLEKINPVLDVRDFPVDARLTRVETEGKYLVLHGLVSAPTAE